MSSDRRRNYELRATAIFAKDLEKLDKDINQRIVKSIEGLRSDPFLRKSLRGELRGLCSLRVGDYRGAQVHRNRKIRIQKRYYSPYTLEVNQVIEILDKRIGNPGRIVLEPERS
ncbi:MAG: hypothetical protein OK457_01850 [Thaumarchaeota archaeon]|nr:hypothetical protein [Nitrososphaerota archaeon]